MRHAIHNAPDGNDAPAERKRIMNSIKQINSDRAATLARAATLLATGQIDATAYASRVIGINAAHDEMLACAQRDRAWRKTDRERKATRRAA